MHTRPGRHGRITVIGEEAGQGNRGFGSRLEAFATNATATRRPRFADASPEAVLDREVALVVDQMRRVRAAERAVRLDMIRTECYIDTELMHMEQRTPRYSPYRFPEREKLQRRLFTLGQERRRLMLSVEDRLQALQQRLLDLLNQRSQLAP